MGFGAHLFEWRLATNNSSSASSLQSVYSNTEVEPVDGFETIHQNQEAEMRQPKTRIHEAFLLALAIAAGLLLISSAAVVPVSVAAADGEPEGKQIFVAQKCGNCHGIEAEGIEAKFTTGPMAGPALDDVGSKHEAAWIVDYVQRETQMDGKNHKGPKPKGSEEELQTMADWLVGLGD